jgi:LysR family transcriptional regulator, transcriptional activator of the cysJI operon
MVRILTLRHFHIFITVCDTMNMTEAAGRLFISQSAISQAINELEKYYDVRLFDRFSKKLYLTEAGNKLLSYARHMIRMNIEIEKDMKTLRQNGSIHLGASVTVGATLLPSLAAIYKKIYPNINIEVFEDNTVQIEKRILNDTTDIGLVEGEIVSPDIVSIPFADDELVLICGTDHRFLSLPTVQPSELEKEDFIIREIGSGTRKTFENIMAVHDLSWHASWICNNADTIKAAVIAGLGISVISKRAVVREVKSGELFIKDISGIQFSRKFKIVHHKNKYLTVPMTDFIEFCINSKSK